MSAPGWVIPADFEAMIRRCLEKDPADRDPSAEALDEALAACTCAGAWTESKAAQWWQDHPGRDWSSASQPTLPPPG